MSLMPFKFISVIYFLVFVHRMLLVAFRFCQMQKKNTKIAFELFIERQVQFDSIETV